MTVQAKFACRFAHMLSFEQRKTLLRCKVRIWACISIGYVFTAEFFMKLCIVDTKAANFNSVVQAFKRLDIEATITRDIAKLKQADKLILPGVGSATTLMQGILGCTQQDACVSCHVAQSASNVQEAQDSQLIDYLRSTLQPTLGICLGMQVLTEKSQEVPLNSNIESVATLGLIPGTVHLLDAQGEPMPHMGWNTVRHNDHPLFANIPQDSYFYFVHSFCVDVGPHTIAQCEYGQSFSAAIAKDNFMGVQFHPEKSGAIGAQLLQNFVNL